MKDSARRAAASFYARAFARAEEGAGDGRSWYRFLATDNAAEAEVLIYDEIGMWGVSANQFKSELDALSKDVKVLHVRLNSPGGSVFDGQAIYNALAQSDKHVVMHIDGWAASIASVIAMAGDEINIAENAHVMIHKPWSFVIGNSDDMLKEAAVLDELQAGIVGIYASRTGGDAKKITDQVNAETWFKGQAAVDAGFADKMIPNKKKPSKEDKAKSLPSASFGVGFYAAIFHLPEEVRTNMVEAHAEVVSAAASAAAAEDEQFSFSTATPREMEAFLRAHGATHKQAKDAVVTHFKQPDTRDEETAAREQAARDEQAQRHADQSRDETVKAFETLASAIGIRLAAFNRK